MDIGVWMCRPTLEEKLALRTSSNLEGTRNLRNWPSGFSEGSDSRLFVASEGAWIGYFKTSGEALYHPRDSWHHIPCGSTRTPRPRSNHAWCRASAASLTTYRNWKNSLALIYALPFFMGVGLLPAIRPSQDKGSDDH